MNPKKEGRHPYSWTDFENPRRSTASGARKQAAISSSDPWPPAYRICPTPAPGDYRIDVKVHTCSRWSAWPGRAPQASGCESFFHVLSWNKTGGNSHQVSICSFLRTCGALLFIAAAPAALARASRCCEKLSDIRLRTNSRSRPRGPRPNSRNASRARGRRKKRALCTAKQSAVSKPYSVLTPGSPVTPRANLPSSAAESLMKRYTRLQPRFACRRFSHLRSLPPRGLPRPVQASHSFRALYPLPSDDLLFPSTTEKTASASSAPRL
jgi:hypothetical protein